jgi:hypothetical protein
MPPRIGTSGADIGGPENHCGDATGDGLVAVEDLLWLVDAFGTYPGDPVFDPVCDFNADGAVDVVGLLDLVYGFGGGRERLTVSR